MSRPIVLVGKSWKGVSVRELSALGEWLTCGQLEQALQSLLRQQVLVVQVLEQDVETLLRIPDLNGDGRRGTSLDPLHGGVEHLKDRSVLGGNVGSVALRVLGRGRGRRWRCRRRCSYALGARSGRWPM